MYQSNNKYLKTIIRYSFFILILSCTQKADTQYLNTIFDEPCMIVNIEQDNTIEGHYLYVESIKKKDTLYEIAINLPEEFYINKTNYNNWIIGVGNNKPYYDSGTENLWEITNIDNANKKITIGKCLRGTGIPQINQRVVLWNTCPSGFYNYIKAPIIEPSNWKSFNGEEVYFGAIEYDSTLNHYYMIFNETAKTEINIFAAYSDNIINWYPANNGEPILNAKDFKHTTWAGKDITGEYLQTPYSSELIHHNNKWYLFLYGFNNDGKRQIGLAVSDSTILGPYTIYKDPIISNGGWLSWDENACLSARVTKYKDRFIMFYNALNRKGNEKLGLATSSDLIHWQKYNRNPVLAQNTGWRSCKKVAEPNYIEVRNDSIFIIVLGAKKFKSGLWHQYVTKRLYMDKSGNVDDNQYGFYLSIDGGQSFVAHKNNPIFINDYSNIYENGHLGGGFKYIITDTSEFIIYQAKTTYNSMGYNIMVRERKKQ